MPVVVAGVDPGLVDTGIVAFGFFPDTKHIEIHPRVVTRGSADDVIKMLRSVVVPADPVFVEAYRPRRAFSTNSEMQALTREITAKAGWNAKALPNTGIKSVVRPQLLRLLAADRFTIPTRHSDLVSAARIAVLGMLKDEELNKLLSDVVLDHLQGSTWSTKTF
jgi:hypothetical protein